MGNVNNDFSNHIFVDETSVWIGECRLYHYRHRGTYPQAVGFSSKDRHKLNLWGGISARGVTPFIVKTLVFLKGTIENKILFIFSFKKTFENNMNKEMYCEILCDYLLPFAYSRYGNNWFLHQDNDPKHTSAFCRFFIQSQNILWVKKFKQSPFLTLFVVIFN